jgi:AcrR family transcriptional regulator
MGTYNRKTREERLQEIRQAALKVFLDKGYRNTTMEDIVAGTSLSKGGLYHYYGSTKEIIFDIMRYGNKRYFDEIELTGNGSKEEICALLSETAINRIVQKTDERKLYLMFSYEILYDHDFEKLFLELQAESLNLLNRQIRTMSGFSISDQGKQLFISRIINALLFAQNLYSDSSVFSEQRTALFNILYKLFLDSLE